MTSLLQAWPLAGGSIGEWQKLYKVQPQEGFRALGTFVWMCLFSLVIFLILLLYPSWWSSSEWFTAQSSSLMFLPHDVFEQYKEPTVNWNPWNHEPWKKQNNQKQPKSYFLIVPPLVFFISGTLTTQVLLKFPKSFKIYKAASNLAFWKTWVEQFYYGELFEYRCESGILGTWVICWQWTFLLLFRDSNFATVWNIT